MEEKVRQRIKWEKNKEKYNEQRRERYKLEYQNSKEYRARQRIKKHKVIDKKYNRGEGDLTVDWYVENILNQRCVYCGENDWRKLGTDRKNNNLPHTKENCVPCCKRCNNIKGRKTYEEYILELGTGHATV